MYRFCTFGANCADFVQLRNFFLIRDTDDCLILNQLLQDILRRCTGCSEQKHYTSRCHVIKNCEKKVTGI